MCFQKHARRWGHVLACTIIILSFIDVEPAQAAPENTLVIRNDRGGVIRARVQQVAALSRAGTRVEIREGSCLSSCTMLLAVQDVCVSPRAQFGFHGPSHYGQPLQPDDFEHWSRVISSHYAPTLRTWFMAEARYTTNGYRRLSGAQLIKMGYPRCR